MVTIAQKGTYEIPVNQITTMLWQMFMQNGPTLIKDSLPYIRHTLRITLRDGTVVEADVTNIIKDTQ